MRHIIESQQFHRELLGDLFTEATKLETAKDESMRGKILASLFYEPSTRTRLSFESAMQRLGGMVISTENAKEFSSAAKGETLEDSIRIINHYADAIVLRHFEDDAAARAASVSDVPLINAGSGAGQHPTQALLDLYTIERECGRLDGLTVALCGDLKYGRTIRSLAYLLGKFNDVRIIFASPDTLRVHSDIKEYLDKHKVPYAETNSLEHIVDEVDVLYQTRVQKERFEDPVLYEQVKDSFVIDAPLAQKMRKGAILMHPLPRNGEIAKEVDALPQAVYFKQAGYGVLVRMALLKFLLR
ncbi:MAG TPA: aspartate carbamoyltransferase [Candidatus Paceibacterota bacterium]|nr:aspartate carbamoyltransferase [Candidatus Paceibacterota bacterium]